jgi:hypothetical protein
MDITSVDGGDLLLQENMVKLNGRQIPEAVRLTLAAEDHAKRDARIAGNAVKDGYAIRRRFIGYQSNLQNRFPLL